MAEKKDIVVIGGGPAGLTSAWKLAEKGFSVTLIETKKKAYSYKRPCCAMVILEPEFHNEYVQTEEGELIFQENDFSIPYDGRFHNLYRSVKFSPSGYKFIVAKKSGYPLARTIDKEKFLRTLYHRALDAGVEIREGETGVEVKNVSSGVETRVRKDGNFYTIKSDYAIGADGVNSAVAKSLGLNKDRKLYFVTMVISYDFEDVDCEYSDAFIQCRGKSFSSTGGIACTPKPGEEEGKPVFEVAVSPDPSKGERAEKLLNQFIEKDFVKPWFKNAKMTTIRGCKWYLYDPIPNPVCGNVILIGDAPSFQEVENQGALMCAVKSAEAIAKELEGKEGFAGYRDFWSKSFEFNDPQVLYATARGFGIRRFKDDEIDFLFSLVDKEILNGTINHFKVGETMLEEFAKRFDIIRKKRPDIAEKLSQFTNQKIEKFFD